MGGRVRSTVASVSGYAALLVVADSTIVEHRVGARHPSLGGCPQSGSPAADLRSRGWCDAAWVDSRVELRLDRAVHVAVDVVEAQSPHRALTRQDLGDAGLQPG